MTIPLSTTYAFLGYCRLFLAERGRKLEEGLGLVKVIAG